MSIDSTYSVAMDSNTAGAARDAALDALRGWPVLRNRLPEHRADLMAAAWWSGTRNVSALAAAADVTRDTAYADLRSRGINPADRIERAAPPPPPRYRPLNADKLRELAKLAQDAVLPAQLNPDRGDPLATAAWQTAIALERVADALTADAPGPAAEELADRLASALSYAHGHWAAAVPENELRDQTERAVFDDLENQAVVGSAVVGLALPDEDGGGVDVTLHHVGGVVSLARAGRPEFDTSRILTPAETLEVKAAFRTLGRILGERMRGDVELDEVPPIRICGASYDRNPNRSCTLPPGHGHHVHQTATGMQWPVAP